MRVTCDYDFKSRAKLKYYLLKGRLLCGKWADNIYATRRGYHVIYHSLPISQERMFELRKKLGDDSHRLGLDMQGNRLKNVLFNQKKITYVSEDGYITKQEEFIRRQIK